MIPTTIFRRAVVVCGLAAALSSWAAPIDIHYGAAANMQTSSGAFAPYMIASWNYGRTSAKNAATADVWAHKNLDLSRRFDWAAGVEVLAGYSHKQSYDRYDAAANTWGTHHNGAAAIWLQQLYASVKYRGVFLAVGMQEQAGILLDNDLSSGDLVQSNNARPIPQVRTGFVDFQNIPFTKGWVQIEGQITYGKFAHNDWLRAQYYMWNSHLTTGELYTYKRVYFRTKPSMPLSVTIGAQCAGHFGGVTRFYREGKIVSEVKNRSDAKAFWEMLVPGRGNGDGWVEGSSLGSWDFNARYRFAGGQELSGYFQWLWEDGSSMAKRNKWDGLWGIRWHNPQGKWLHTAVVEYIDMRDQSGPIHWAPNDRPCTTITSEASGADDYYNNSSFNAHHNYGMAIGSPFAVAPLYNRDGYPQFLHTRTSGFHAAATGSIASTSLDWTIKLSWAQARGNGRLNTPKQLHDTSAMVRLDWDASKVCPGLNIAATAAFDAGDLRGDNFGALVTIAYRGLLSFK